MTGDRQKKTQQAVTGGGSALRRYQNVIVGRRSILALIYYEWCMLAGAVPGAIGLLMRKLFWPRLFGACGAGVLFGANVILRHPHRVELGERCVISDGCILEARTDSSTAIKIGADSILSNNVMISCKNGTVDIGKRAGIGAQTIMHAVNGCAVEIGDDVLIGPRCYFAGGGNYNTDRTDIPMALQGLKDKTGVELGSDIWLGANVSVLSGVTIGDGSIVAAGAVVTSAIPDKGVAMGVPAKVARFRGEN